MSSVIESIYLSSYKSSSGVLKLNFGLPGGDGMTISEKHCLATLRGSKLRQKFKNVYGQEKGVKVE